MTWIIFALGLAMMLAGGGTIVAGVPYMQIEFGWSEVIAGATILAGGGVILSIGLATHEIGRQIRRLAAAVPVPLSTDADTGEPVVAVPAPMLQADREETAAAPAIAADDEREPERDAEPAPVRVGLPAVADLEPHGGAPSAIGAPPVAASSPSWFDRPGPDIPESAPQRVSTAFEPAEAVTEATEGSVEPPPTAPSQPQEPLPRRSTLTSFRERWANRRRVPEPAPAEEPEPPPPLGPYDTTVIESTTAASVTLAESEPEPEPQETTEAVPVPAASYDDLEPAAEPETLSAEPDAEVESAPDPERGEVVGRFESGGTSYVLFADGSIDVHTETGVHRFASMDELKDFIGRA